MMSKPSWENPLNCQRVGNGESGIAFIERV